jgi:tetratricopeptide (TPR) repeat protein
LTKRHKLFLAPILLSLHYPAIAASDAPGEYADSRVCATCHQNIARDYRETGMGRSFFTPRPENTVEDYTTHNQYHHARSNTDYAMVARDGSVYQQRWQLGFNGEKTNFEELKIDYVLGSGNHSRSYVHRTARGTLIQLPLCWYPEKGGYWALAPGFDTGHPQTRRYISYECMFCHNAYPRIPAGHERPGADPIFETNLPEGIDCQRCHGPGAAHVRAAQSAGAKLTAIRASIVNPARLSPKLQNDVCMQCHLLPTSDPFPALIKRFNRGPFSFRPGEPLEDFELTFDYAPAAGRANKFEAVSSPYRLRQSRCFTESGGALTCKTCHNPHRILRGESAMAAYTKVCNQCHASRIQTLVAAGRHPASDRCVECHMPKRRTQDAVHIVMTDHRIQRRPPPGDLLAEFEEKPAEEYRGEVVPYYPSPLPERADSPLYLAVAQVAFKNNLGNGIKDLTAALEKAAAPPAEFYVAEFYKVLGDALEAESRHQDAAAAYASALKLDPLIPGGAWALAGAFRAAGRLADSQRILKAATEANGQDPNLWHRYALTAADLGRVPEAIGMMRKALMLDPTLPGQYTDLADLLAKAGQSNEAEAALKQALRIDPFDATAYNLMGRILIARNSIADALYNFKKSVDLQPAQGPNLYDYAIALVTADRFDDAREYATEAIRNDPKMADAHELLGSLLMRRQQYLDAIREYRQALDLEPASDRLQLRLGVALASGGDTRNALEHLQIAGNSSDFSIAQQARGILARLRVSSVR